MKKDIIIAGVGGQGILSIASVLGYTAVKAGLELKQSEVHGMSQRGGDVQSHLRISDKEIYSDLIPQGLADLIVSVEPMESLRYLPWLCENGWLITNSIPFINTIKYPDIELLLNEINNFKNHILIDAEDIAKKSASARSANMVMLGATSPFLGLTNEQLEDGIAGIFGRKGEKIVQQNIDAFRAGKKFAEENVNKILITK
jgi:indolepyruvate ferredoxin oxidoreductase beta subunit